MTKQRPEQIITNYILENFKDNKIPWRQPLKEGVHHTFQSPLRHNMVPYRGINVLVLTVATLRNSYTCPCWITYKQCAKEGGNIRQSQKGVSVLKFGQLEVHNNATERESRFMPYAAKYSVFNIEQAENLSDDFLNVRMVAEKPTHQIHDYIAAAGANILHGSDKAAYYPSFDTIRLPNQSSFDHDENYAGVLAHELIHWTAHPDRLNRVFDYQKPADRAIEELVAEIGSMMLCSRLGISSDIDQHQIPYIAEWVHEMENNSRYILQASSLAEKAVNWILDKASVETTREVA